MSPLRPLLSLILSLAVILSGAASAVARAEMAAAVYPVICGEFGPSGTQAFDVTGKPLTQGHACPHCLAGGALAAALIAPPCAWTPLATEVRAVLSPQTLCPAPAAGGTRPEARGPPALI